MSWAEAVAAVAVATPFAIGASVGAEPERPVVEFRFADPAIVESSGLVVYEGSFVTTNDSGDSARVFVVDPQSGETTKTARWWRDPVDVEALAPLRNGQGVLVGDIGDNAGERATVTATEVWLHSAADMMSIEPPTYELRYPDGPRDAETLLVHPRSGRVLIASKGILAGALYEAPRRLRTDRVNRLEVVADLPGMLTDGAFFPDGRHLVVRDYGQMYVYSYPALEALGRVDLPEQPQGEGIAVDERGRVFVSTEGQHTPVYRVPLPARITDAMTERDATASSTPSASAPPAVADPDAGDEPTDDEPGWWPWLLGPIIGLLMIVVLVRALRPR